MLTYIFKLVNFFLFLFLGLQLIKFSLYCFYVWQVVEYRQDRLKARLTNLGDKNEYYRYLNFLNFYSFNKYPQATARIFLTFLFFIVISYQLFFTIYRSLVKWVPFEDKFAITLLLVFLIIYYLTPILSSLIVFGLNFIFGPVKKLIIYFAKQKIKKNTNLIIIGITGSFGKSITKEIIAAVLGLNYKVLKTPANNNTEMGIAKTILFSLKKTHEIFVVEMGAYKRGEIKKICDLVSPKIGLISGISEQHLALFGSLNNTLKAKYELIESLPAFGLALFNAKNKYCQRLNNKKKQCRSLLYGRKTKEFEESLAAGKLLGRYFKIPKGKIKRLTPKLKKLLALERKRGRGGILILDDSYSSNPDGFKKALKLIAREKKQRIIVTPGIIELGKAGNSIHRQLGKTMAEIADKIIITSQNFAPAFEKGVNKEQQRKFLISNSELAIADYLKGCFNRDWLILWEGRVPLNVKNIFAKKYE